MREGEGGEREGERGKEEREGERGERREGVREEGEERGVQVRKKEEGVKSSAMRTSLSWTFPGKVQGSNWCHMTAKRIVWGVTCKMGGEGSMLSDKATEVNRQHSG